MQHKEESRTVLSKYIQALPLSRDKYTYQATEFMLPFVFSILPTTSEVIRLSMLRHDHARRVGLDTGATAGSFR